MSADEFPGEEEQVVTNSVPLMYAICTVDDQEAEEGAVFRLLDSVRPEGVSVVVVARDTRPGTDLRLREHPATAQVVKVPKCGLSAARNAGLAELARLGVGDSAVVCFPDDDCTYPPGLGQRVLMHMGPHDLLLGRYAERVPASAEAPRTMKYPDVFHHGNSVGIFVRFGLVKRVGGFDIRLGVGSGDVAAAEDVEFLARCILTQDISPVFDPGVVVLHPVSVGPRERAGAYIVVARRYWRHSESWVRVVRVVVGILLRKSPVPMSRMPHLLRRRPRIGWDGEAVRD